MEQSLSQVSTIYEYLKKEPTPIQSALLIFSKNLFYKIEKHYAHAEKKSFLYSEVLLLKPNLNDSTVALVCPNGYGPSTAALVVEELELCGVKRILSVGGAGALSSSTPVGSVWRVQSALSDESVSTAYGLSDSEVGFHWFEPPLSVAQMVGDLKVWTYSAPMMETPAKIAWALSKGCQAVEMEVSVLYFLSRKKGIECISYVCITDMFLENKWSLHWRDGLVKQNLERAALSILNHLLIGS